MPKAPKKASSSLKSVDTNRIDDIAFESHYHAEDMHGVEDHTVKIVRHRDGGMYIFFSVGNGDGFVYLYPEQVKHLKRILKMRWTQKKSPRKSQK